MRWLLAVALLVCIGCVQPDAVKGQAVAGDVTEGLKIEASPQQTITVGKSSSLQAMLAGVGVLTLILLWLYVRRSKLTRRVGTLLSTAIESVPGNEDVRMSIREQAWKLGVSEAEVRRFRKLVGTQSRG